METASRWARRRRRRRRICDELMTLLVWITSLASAQQAASVQTIAAPALLRFNLTAASSMAFHLPAPAAHPQRVATYSVTLNICSPPSESAVNTLFTTDVLFLSTSNSLTTPTRATPPPATAGSSSAAAGGFANVTVTAALPNGVWIGVTAPSDGGDAIPWQFELGTSTSGVPMHVIDPFPLLEYDDSDNSTALLTSPTFYPTLSGVPSHNVVVMPTANLPSGLTLSSCFLSTMSSATVPASSIAVSNTTRGVTLLTAREGGTPVQVAQANAGGLRMQFALSGLQRSTNYTAWGIDNATSPTAGQQPSVRLYPPQYFRTKGTENCRLITNFDTCPAIAYAVPSPPNLATPNLLEVYRQRVLPHLGAFNLTLSTFPCDSRQFGLYSVVRTCDDCMSAYTNWLCSVVVPRCDDVPANDAADAAQTLAAANALDTGQQFSFSNNSVPSTIQTVLIRSQPLVSRTPMFSPVGLTNLTASNATLVPAGTTSPFPYAEPPPCSSLCNLVAASCPPFLGWQCPLVDVTLSAGYGALHPMSDGDVQGGDAGRLGGGQAFGWGHAADRYGNVYCNALGSDVLLARRSSDARAAVMTLGRPGLVLVVMAVSHGLFLVCT